jgi:hypothetical protein
MKEQKEDMLIPKSPMIKERLDFELMLLPIQVIPVTFDCSGFL